MSERNYFDIPRNIFGESPDILFQDWNPADESVVILSPHDDDAVIGAGYMIDMLLHANIPVKIIIFCKGDAGYSVAGLRDVIVDTRKEETLLAYSHLGMAAEDIVMLDKPDFGLRRHVAWDGVGHENGLFGEMIRLLRKFKTTRLFIANGNREHIDHTAVYEIGLYHGIQSSDPILADFGLPVKLRSVHVYSVWADFSPEDALVAGRSTDLRANMGMVVDKIVEEHINESIRFYVSQGQIIENLIRMRASKQSKKGWVELYQLINPRPRLPYAPYVSWVDDH